MNWLKPWCTGIVISFVITFSALSVPLPEKTLSEAEFKRFHQCSKFFEYKIYLAGANIGYSRRTIDWRNTEGEISANITATGEVSIFWLGSTYHQNSTSVWSKQKQYFVTQAFSQKVTGIKSREMAVTTAEFGKQSTVNLDGKISNFTNIKAPLLDLDTLGAQLRVNLIQGKTDFTLFRQGTEEIKPYVFNVVGKETLKLEKWGKVETIKVREVGEYKKMVLWFSPSHDWQLIKANVDAFISPTVLLTDFSIKCHK